MKDFSKIASSLTRLTQKKVEFRWTDACEESFQKFKEYLTSTPIFALPIGGESYAVYCDASRRRYLNLRQRRWMKLLKDYDCTILYHLGKANVVANALSKKSMGSLAHIAEVKRPNSFKKLLKVEFNLNLVIRDFSVDSDGVLRLKARLCVPNVGGLRRKNLEEAEHQKPARLLQPIEIPEWKWEDIAMDFVTGLPRTPKGYDSVWVIIDRLTKSENVFPVKTNYIVSQYAKLYLDEIVSLHGVPVSIISDCGS
uniref:Uncharacterized protein LOC105852742 n=1 Tax=Cicer arietinum TaxID=3827 RepID=A0A1S3EHH7_CICAR|nr:uncharacterized protein LOC105852742 [Cicer arietinum]